MGRTVNSEYPSLEGKTELDIWGEAGRKAREFSDQGYIPILTNVPGHKDSDIPYDAPEQEYQGKTIPAETYKGSRVVYIPQKAVPPKPTDEQLTISENIAKVRNDLIKTLKIEDPLTIDPGKDASDAAFDFLKSHEKRFGKVSPEIQKLSKEVFTQTFQASHLKKDSLTQVLSQGLSMANAHEERIARETEEQRRYERGLAIKEEEKAAKEAEKAEAKIGKLTDVEKENVRSFNQDIRVLEPKLKELELLKNNKKYSQPYLETKTALDSLKKQRDAIINKETKVEETTVLAKTVKIEGKDYHDGDTYTDKNGKQFRVKVK